MADTSTCGQGLAAHAELPQLAGDLIASIADTLEAHLPTLVAGDAHAEQERRVYQEVGSGLRNAAARLRATSAAMAAQRNLPMGAHDVDATSAALMAGALAGLIDAEAELVTRLQEHLTEHQTMLDVLRRDE